MDLEEEEAGDESSSSNTSQADSSKDPSVARRGSECVYVCEADVEKCAIGCGVHMADSNNTGGDDAR